jgi:hypothetical protein
MKTIEVSGDVVTFVWPPTLKKTAEVRALFCNFVVGRTDRVFLFSTKMSRYTADVNRHHCIGLYRLCA